MRRRRDTGNHRTNRASRYSRYERSRSPRDRSPDRFDRTPQYNDGDRRRPSDARAGNGGFQPGRDFGDPLRREPPRGPKALIDAPSGPRGGGFGGEFRGGRGRGRGRGWSSRDDSRDRGRDRDIDFRDRYHDDRSRERDRDWREPRDFRSRRSPIGRARSPTRDFRDRDGPLGVDADRSRRGSRDGGPPSAGSSSSDPQFGMAPYPRGGGFHRGRGRGRGDWSSERGRGRGPYMDDRGDRYPRSRSQEGRWARDRDDRDRMDRHADPDTRRDIRDDRDPRDRELFRNKLEARANAGHDSGLSSKEVSPPPAAPSASAFGPVPNRGLSVGEGYVSASAATKIPPTAPRAFNDRPPSAGHDPTMPSVGLGKGMMHDGPSIPVGPRAQQLPPPRPSSKQWINPNLKKGPDSPKLMRSPSFVQQRPPLRRGSSQYDHYHDDERRPRSSDAKSEPHYDNRARTNYSAEPGEITVKSERESQSARASMDRDTRPTNASRRDSYRSGPSPTMENMPRFGQESEIRARDPREALKGAPRRKRSQPIIRAVRFEVPPKPAPVEQNSESDDDDDMADYFDMEIGKTEAELSKLEKPKLPTQVMARFAALSHGSMVKIIGEGEGLLKMVKRLPEAVNKRVIEKIHDPKPIKEAKEDVEMADAVDSTDKIVSEPPKQLHQEVQAELDPEPEHSIQVKGSEEPVEAAPAPESAAQGGQEITERPIEHAAKAAGEKIDDSFHEEAALSLDKTPEQSHIEKSDEQHTEKPVKQPVEQPIEESLGKPTEVTEENHVEKLVPKAENEDTEMSIAPELEPKSGAMDIDEPPTETDRVVPDSPPSSSNKKAVGVLSMASETAPTESLEPQKAERTPLGASEDSHKERSDKDKPIDITAEANGVQPTQTPVEKPTEALPEPTPANPDDAVSEKPAEPFTEPRPENLIETAEALGHRQAAIEGAPVSVVCPNVVLQTTETASKPPSTPSQVDDDETESEDDSFMNLDTVRQYMTTPPIDSLPDYSCMPWDKDSAFLKTLDYSIALDEFVVEHLDKMHLEKSAEQDHDRKIYKDNYERYLDFTMSNDPAAVKSRGKFSVSTGIEITGTVTPEPKHEGSGRGRRFATERDLERVLQASMREDEERKERELRMQQEKYRTDKEAIIPNMIWSQEEKDNTKYLDKSGFTPVDRLVSAWRVLPLVNNFTEEEAGLFEKRYLEAPKQWGRVAEAIPHRDFGSCIQYYYMNKKDLNLKEKLKKQPKRRRKGKAKQRSSALVSELGNGDGETEENHDAGENGERRRPRRAAAPTWGFEQPPVDTENSTPNATPGRRGGSAKVDHPEKVDGRKRRRGPKEKEPKAAKANQTLAAAPGPGKGRSRSNSRALNTDGPSTPLPAAESHRLPGQFEQHPAGMQLPFSVQQQQQQQQQQPQQPIQTLERQQSVAPSSISEVMAAPSLRPDPPPQPAMATFNLAHPPSERKAPTQASSYWSVSESNDFPLLLRSFGSDWTGIAAHMGSKTAVMVKNYFVRQKDQGKAEWEVLVQEADRKRAIGDKLPDPPQPSTGGRGRRYDSSAAASRPLAVAPGIDLHGETSQPKMEPSVQPPRGQPFGIYGSPIAQAPITQQPLVQPQQQPMPIGQHSTTKPVTQTMSPGSRPLRAPVRQFGFPDGERERDRDREQSVRVPLPQKASSRPPGSEPREQRPLAAAQPLQPARSETMIEHNAQMERQKMEIQRLEQEQLEMARHSERRVKQEPEVTPQPHRYEPFGHRQQGSLGGQPLARPPQELGRPPSYAPPLQQQAPVQPVRNLMGEQTPVRSPQMSTPSSRPMSALQHRPSSGSMHEQYGSVTPQAGTPVQPPAAAPRAAEPRKGGLNIMSLLNDDPPPQPKRVSDVTSTPTRPSPTPPPQAMGRTLPGPAPPSQMRRGEAESYSPYGRGTPVMPSLKPTYADSPQPQHMGSSRASIGVSLEAAAERDYYRQNPYQPSSHSRTNSPQSGHRYAPPGPPQYQNQGYPTSYAATGQPAHAGSPGGQYALHPSASRAREVPQGGREASWPSPQQPPSSMQQPPGWASQQPPNAQPPPQQQQQQPWPTQHPSSKPQTPAPSWAPSQPPSQPPPQQAHHMSMRDDGRNSYFASGPGMPPQQHQMQGRYPPTVSRGPESVPPPQPYSRYASTPGPGPPREIPGRSYTPISSYDSRGPPQPPPGAPVYPGHDPRDPRGDPRVDPRDPRDMMRGGLRPHEYERPPPDHYRR
ncbi:hypothetical protein H9Q72_007645 [Fusarium xylarioides]|uniref:SANT domain-containing protein n=1 Tax=Fusarium xylarioides TaxID=221167 RepID=A0A9P7HVZ0_9HYPO|nr:hypothetical protein H9Q70_006522 [Fusarium xylarioides]KAG5764284.1 hypothetical protein H9Q72_007645 [Fusarium xylarioides]